MMWQLRQLEFSDDTPMLDLNLRIERSYADAFCFGFLGLVSERSLPVWGWGAAS
jgi:hypothetical protein